MTIEGPAYDVIREAVRTAVGTVQGIRVLGSTGFEEISYPEVTLHEIITNAVLHRDYSISDDIHVRIFDNRVEVESPGGLPAHLTPENILTQRFARNGNIVRWISKFPDPPNKDVGEGLNTAFAAMRNLKLKAPEVENKVSSVLVRIRVDRHRIGEPSKTHLPENDQGRRSRAHTRPFFALHGLQIVRSRGWIVFRERHSAVASNVSSRVRCALTIAAFR